MKVLVEMSDDPEFPRNFDCCITVMTDWNFGPDAFLRMDGTAKKEVLSLDQEMMLYYPEHYSDGMAWTESGQYQNHVR